MEIRPDHVPQLHQFIRSHIAAPWGGKPFPGRSWQPIVNTWLPLYCVRTSGWDNSLCAGDRCPR
jgi:hypothetical protein